MGMESWGLVSKSSHMNNLHVSLSPSFPLRPELWGRDEINMISKRLHLSLHTTETAVFWREKQVNYTKM